MLDKDACIGSHGLLTAEKRQLHHVVAKKCPAVTKMGSVQGFSKVTKRASRLDKDACIGSHGLLIAEKRQLHHVVTKKCPAATKMCSVQGFSKVTKRTKIPIL
ncbi:hypothetical protein TNIN_67231 [Trichonephila inaurata madagascariensis]|uniref:Uncharacterized protein n=1 Tax=Trichonephila inaurata madagascariensis TaxID=2747483 RepID=A0A8X6MDS8_9ARAC|nr:hypothetical protein TNIN_67231 [Trichonephila inaurata madagascariensis]